MTAEQNSNLNTMMSSDKNNGLTWGNQKHILCPVHHVYGKVRIKTIKGRRYVYCHHWWLKRAVDCYLGPAGE